MLSAIAVDSAKSNIFVSSEVRKDYKIQDYPDFMGRDQSYPSEHILGKLYRKLQEMID